MKEMNEKHKNLMSESNNSFSEAVGKKQLDLTITEKKKHGRRLLLRRHPEWSRHAGETSQENQ